MIGYFFNLFVLCFLFFLNVLFDDLLLLIKEVMFFVLEYFIFLFDVFVIKLYILRSGDYYLLF